MSELKVYLCEKASEIESKDFLCYRFKFASKPSLKATMEEVYLKSEADEVIEELKKEKIYAIDHVSEVINGQERELRHHKYKRCLAMAKICDDEFDKLIYLRDGEWEKWKWHIRKGKWLRLAKNFKEDK